MPDTERIAELEALEDEIERNLDESEATLAKARAFLDDCKGLAHDKSGLTDEQTEHLQQRLRELTPAMYIATFLGLSDWIRSEATGPVYTLVCYQREMISVAFTELHDLLDDGEEGNPIADGLALWEELFGTYELTEAFA